MNKIILLLLTVTFSPFAFSCPNLTGRFVCPGFESDPGFELKISQLKKKNGVTFYKFDKKFIDSDGKTQISGVTIAGDGRSLKHSTSPVPVKEGFDGLVGRCKGKKLDVKNTLNYINANNHLEASYNGAIASVCKRK